MFQAERVVITVSGRVQGVGFRPFIYRLAHLHRLVGSVSNTCTGVKIDVQGRGESLAQFRQDILSQKPAQAVITDFHACSAPLCDASGFAIIESLQQAEKGLALLPDTALCAECKRELFDPQNRRYLYPFLHCISCGPRFSLFLRMPFDRDNTTMRSFCMCEECQVEYNNPENRRFYSQTNCCPNCGPLLQLVDPQKNVLATKSEAIEAAASFLEQGKIVAMKNTGGYLLLADATNEEAVKLLRTRKRRRGKPFALLMPTLADSEAIAHVGSIERGVLTSPASPIVLLKKREAALAYSVAHESPYYGVMLPHSPLQHLLMHRIAKPLVATSGNISGMPLCTSEEEAFATLTSIADLFLIHNRAIAHRLDDSIVHVMAEQPVVIRKARGYIPMAIPLSEQAQRQSPLFAAGSHMKNSFAILKQKNIYISQHMGDLDSVESCRAYEEEVNSWEQLLGIEKADGVGDKHPHYYGGQFLEKRGLVVEKVQHHKAHVLAAMVDSKLFAPFFSVAWDGTGWGDDGTIWGAETFLAAEEGLKRFSTLYPFLLPGGEKAVREPRRSLLGLLYEMAGDVCCAQEYFSDDELTILSMVLKKRVNAPTCSSMGRLFDGVSALLGLCRINDFEGQAALLLEKAAYQAPENGKTYELPLSIENDLYVLDWRPMIRAMYEDKLQGVLPSAISMAFHETLARAIVDLAKRADHESVLLTGGVMQNKLLVEKTVSYLRAAGFKPYIHRDIPPNDGGIAVGQLMGKYVLSSTR